MSDLMGGMGNGASPTDQGSPGTEQAMKDTRSLFNPVDAAGMKQDGTITPDMTIKDFFATLGIDVDNDPISKLAELQKQQMFNADPLNKMKTIADQGSPSSAPQGAPAPVGKPPEVQQQPGGLGGLQTRLGG
jgi:hypothetical protein